MEILKQSAALIAVIVLYRVSLWLSCVSQIMTQCHKLSPIVLWISCSVAIDDISHHANKYLEKVINQKISLAYFHSVSVNRTCVKMIKLPILLCLIFR